MSDNYTYIPILILGGGIAYTWWNGLVSPPIVNPFDFTWIVKSFSINETDKSFISDVKKEYGDKAALVKNVVFTPILSKTGSVLSSSFTITTDKVWGKELKVNIPGSYDLYGIANRARINNHLVHLVIYITGVSDKVPQILTDTFHFVIDPRVILDAQTVGLANALGVRSLTQEEINALPQLPILQPSETDIKNTEYGTIVIPISNYASY